VRLRSPHVGPRTSACARTLARARPWCNGSSLRSGVTAATGADDDSMDLRYTSDFHLVRPYGNESGVGWGVGDGTVAGERLSGSTQWSNQPRRPGRTVFVERDGATVGASCS
jgi:hypothetical protein